MRKFHCLLALALTVPGTAEAAKWRGENGDLYDTLGECFKQNYSCSVARLVKVADFEALQAANAAAARSRTSGRPEDVVHYVLAAPGRPAAAAAATTTGCLTKKGTVHRPPCDKEKDQTIFVPDK